MAEPLSDEEIEAVRADHSAALALANQHPEEGKPFTEWVGRVLATIDSLRAEIDRLQK